LKTWSQFEKNVEIARQVCVLLQAQHKTVASAESCTGGLLATFMTETPGSSLVYQGGVCCYSNTSKSSLFSIPMTIFESVGAVSEEVAHKLAKQVRSLLAADYGLGVTGVAGPDGGTELKPVGTIWCAIYGKNVNNVWKLNLKGDRHSIRLQTAEHVLNEFLKILMRS
jgi:nicotinamide-nucleotide amidase